MLGSDAEDDDDDARSCHFGGTILLPTGRPGHEMEQARYWRVARSKNGTKMRQREGRWKYKSVVMAGAILRQGRHDERNGRHIQMQLSLDQRRNES